MADYDEYSDGYHGGKEDAFEEIRDYLDRVVGNSYLAEYDHTCTINEKALADIWLMVNGKEPRFFPKFTSIAELYVEDRGKPTPTVKPWSE